ncbi:MAG: cytochrome c-type biogenesis protein CcmH [Hyphomonadaceae bacterium]|nr:cytochrome c-type biogenesis protein CcmH [Hyphomonadaceae bacterium]
MKIIHAIFILFSLLVSGSALAQSSTEAELEARAREVGQSLRCVVCQNQSIEESDAVLAEDMRRLVRKRLEAGDSNADVINFMQDRYGDFVLLKPPVQTNTYLLWFGPFILLFGMLFWFVRKTRKRSETSPVIPPLDDEEKQRLERLLGDEQ